MFLQSCILALILMQVGYAEQQSLVAYSKKLFTVPSDPEFGNQWSLVRTYYTIVQYFWNNYHCYSCCSIMLQLNIGQINSSAGRDLNVVPAWIQGLTGKGVVVSVVDDGKT